MTKQVLSNPSADTANKLVHLINDLDPNLSVDDIFRVGHLLTKHADPERLDQADYLKDVWLELCLRLQAAADQQAAVSEELDNLASTDPQKFKPDQVWLLIKAIKILSQTLEFYSK